METFLSPVKTIICQPQYWCVLINLYKRAKCPLISSPRIQMSIDLLGSVIYTWMSVLFTFKTFKWLLETLGRSADRYISEGRALKMVFWCTGAGSHCHSIVLHWTSHQLHLLSVSCDCPHFPTLVTPSSCPQPSPQPCFLSTSFQSTNLNSSQELQCTYTHFEVGHFKEWKYSKIVLLWSLQLVFLWFCKTLWDAFWMCFSAVQIEVDWADWRLLHWICSKPLHLIIQCASISCVMSSRLLIANSKLLLPVSNIRKYFVCL